MARVQIASLPLGAIQTRSGGARPHRTLKITRDGHPATVYAAPKGKATTVPSSGPDGFVAGWLDPGEYTFTLGTKSIVVQVVSHDQFVQALQRVAGLEQRLKQTTAKIPDASVLDALYRTAADLHERLTVLEDGAASALVVDTLKTELEHFSTLLQRMVRDVRTLRKAA